VGAAPPGKTGAPTRRPTHPSSPVCLSAAALGRRTRVFLSGGGCPPPWRPPGSPWPPPPPPVLLVLVVAVTCVAPNALSTVCSPLPVRMCWRVRGHRPTLALLDGPYRLSGAKSRTLLPTLTVPYIYFFFDTMLTISEHLCVGLMVSL
jgi:hypothetical protein